MKPVCRFSPSSNGSLHLGHLFTIFVNEYYAHSNNGKFIVRFDDATNLVRSMPKGKPEKIMKYQREDIEWMEFEVDEWIYESEIHHEVRERLHKLGWKDIYEAPLGSEIAPMVMKEEKGWVAIPYVPNMTAERVVMDNMIKTTHIIRGDDFMTEFSLYSYFCQIFEFHTPEFVFLPRLTGIRGDISKTAGGFKIADLRSNGYTPQEIRTMMAKACLISPGNGFQLYNIKSYPQVIL